MCNVRCKIISAVVVICLAIVIACIADSYHKTNEGNVGIYYRHSALKEHVTAPGVHFMMPGLQGGVNQAQDLHHGGREGHPQREREPL